MSLFGKLMDSIRLSGEGEDDDYFLDDDYNDEKPVRKGLFGKRNDDYYDDDEDYEDAFEEDHDNY